MKGLLTLLVLSTFILSAHSYFSNDEHKEKMRDLLNQFVDNFKAKYHAISMSGIDFHSKMDLGFGYWVTKIRLTNYESASTESDLIQFSAPQITIELVVEDKWTIPVKVRDFVYSVILNTGPKDLRCTGVQIEYGDISLDINSVLEYLSRQLLSLDMLKKAVKEAEIPMRNLFANAIRNNRERLQWLFKYVDENEVNTKSWVDFLELVQHTRSEDGEYILSIKDMFNIPSVRYPEKKAEDL